MHDDDRIAEVLEEWYERREKGLDCDPKAVVQAHPELAEELIRHFAALEAFDRLAGTRAAAETPRVLGEFRILRELGRGGMGVVYEAEQASMHRSVALKVLYPGVTGSLRAVRRFRREAQAAGRLHHTHIVPVYGMGEEGGVWYYAMELVRGRPLHEVLEDRRRLKGEDAKAGAAGGEPGTRRSYDHLAGMFAGVAEGLQTAHEAGVVHRDVKPSNLLLDDGGTLRLTDFGLARVDDDGPTMTLAGDLLGTPAYMSPEQAGGEGEVVDARTDVYSLGATLYEALTLRPPYRGKSATEVAAAVLTRDPPAPRRLEPRVPRDLETVVLKAMERDPQRRYSTAGELAADLRRYAEGGAIRARRIGIAGRIWRLSRRHPVAASLAAGTLLLAGAATALEFRARLAESRRRHDDYIEICTRTMDTLLGGELQGVQSRPPTVNQNIIQLLDEAILLEPDRPEAYLERGLTPGAPTDVKLSVLAKAHACGVGERAWRLANAYVLRVGGRAKEGEEQEAVARSAPPGDRPEDAYFEGSVSLRRGDRIEAGSRLDEAIRAAPDGSDTARLARMARALARTIAGDLSGALADIGSIQRWRTELGSGTRTDMVRLAGILGGLRRDEKLAAVVPLPDAGGLVAVNPATGRVYVLNGYTGGRVWVLDGRTNCRVTSVRTEGYDIGIALDPAHNEVFVADQFSRIVFVIDGATDHVVRSIEIPAPPGRPGATIGRLAFDSKRGVLFVVQNEQILGVDPAVSGPGRVVERIPIGAPWVDIVEIALDPLNRRLFALRRGGKELRAFDLDTGRLTGTGRLPFAAGSMAYDPSMRRILVLSAGVDAMVPVDDATLVSGVPRTVPPGWAGALAADGLGHILLSGSKGNGPLTVYDAATLDRIALVEVAGTISGDSSLAVDPVTRRVFVAYEDGWVDVVDAPFPPPPDRR